MALSPRRRAPLALTALLPVILLAACGGGEDAAPPAPPPAAVTVVTLKSQSLALTRELPGRTNPFLVAEVRPQVSGIVAKQVFTEGSLVQAGQPLYQLDDASYRASRTSADAALKRAQATAESSRLSAARSAELAKIDAISRQDDENAIAAFRQAEADVGVARAALQNADITLGYARISAPITGRIGKSSVTQGALVTANQDQALATIQQLDPMYVDLTQSSSELLQLRREFAAGTLKETDDVPVTLLLEDGTPYDHPGKLAFTDVTVNPETGSFLLRVLVPNPDNLLLPGMYVRAVVSNGERDNGLLVPQEGVTRDPKGQAIAMVVGAGETIESRVIQVTRTIGNQWVVDGGLAAGERVVVEGLQKIRPGAVVTATERSAAPAAAMSPTAQPAASTAAAGTPASGDTDTAPAAADAAGE